MIFLKKNSKKYLNMFYNQISGKKYCHHIFGNIFNKQMRINIMHFRVRGNNVQIIKTVKDGTTGKAKSVPVGSASLTTGTIKNDALAKLSENEHNEVRAWVDKRMSIIKQDLEVRLALLPDMLENYTVAIRKGTVVLSTEDSDRLEKATRIFRRTVAASTSTTKVS